MRRFACIRSSIPQALSRLSLLLLAAQAPLIASASQRPNVLFICGDDHAAYVCGAYGNLRVQTPNLDRLAAQGMRFDRAFCNSPVCTASRQSFLTGRYPRTVGVTQLQTPLPDSEVTLAEMLAQAGYRTAAFGKMHFNSDLTHGFSDRLDLADHHRWLREQPPQPPAADLELLPPWRPFDDPARIWLNSFCRPYAAHDAQMASTWLSEQAAAWLANEPNRPFFLVVSFYEPHSPFHFPVEFAGRHVAAEFVAPPVNAEDRNRIPTVFRDLTPDEKQGITAAYYTSVEFLDLNVGRLLDALARLGRNQNTLVVYLSDHGYLLGQHGRFEKHASYEEVIRTPLLMSYPPLVKPGASTSAMVELVDLVPTVLEVCGLPLPEQIQGRSFKPVLTNPEQPHRQGVIVEYAPNEEAAIRTSRWKLVYLAGLHERQDGYTTGQPPAGREIRLYDLESDPGEIVNLADRLEHRGLRDELLGQLRDHLQKTARLPEETPRGDLFEQLDYLVQPRDARGNE
jgi:choline-sulfatase